MIKAVVFDLDDTLILEYDYIKSGYHVISKKIKNNFNIKQNEKEIFELMLKLLRKNSKKVFNKVLEELNIDYEEKDIEELVNTYRNHYPHIKFCDDVLPCINKLKNKGIKLGIITDGYAITQKNKLNVLKAHKFFEKIIITDELGKEYWKPNPKSFEIMKNFFKIEFEEMMYIGDNPKKDFYIKKFFPIVTARIYRNNAIYLDSDYLEEIHEDYKINDLYNLDLGW